MSSPAVSQGRRPARSTTPSYSAPALDKGLDILELLASHGGSGYTQTQIADQLGKSQSELYRMLACLTRRGYISRGPGDDNYRLTAKLFELAHLHPPTRRLIESALPVMRAFAEQAEQSCHLVVHREHQGVVIAHVDSPSFVSVSVRPGAVLPLHETVSGRVLAAFEPDDLREPWLHGLKDVLKPTPHRALARRLRKVREQGYDRSPSAKVQGVLDLSVPVLNHDGAGVAALSVPYLQPADGEKDAHDAIHLLREAALAIGRAIGAGPIDAASA